MIIIINFDLFLQFHTILIVFVKIYIFQEVLQFLTILMIIENVHNFDFLFTIFENIKNYKTGRGEGECFTENVGLAGVGYTIEIKTSEAGSWEFVFDNVFSETLIGITVLDDWSCTGGKNLAEGVEGEMKCTNEQKEYPAGTYSVKFSSVTCMTGTPGSFVPWREGETPLIKTIKVGDKDYCEGEICK